MERSSRRGQAAIFVIVALVVVAAIVIVLLVRGNIGVEGDLTEFEEVVVFYESCLEREASAAIDLAGVQGGRVIVGDYVQGSDHAPFGSHLDFLGFPVPYWFSVTGNGLVEENVPTEDELERDLAEFIERGIERCDFQSFIDDGYVIEVGDPEVEVKISSDVIDIQSRTDLTLERFESRARVNNRDISINSNLGRMLESARGIYEKQQDELLLENYTIDILHNYVPVDGVLIQCNPEIWQTQQVVDDLEDALEVNLGSLRFEGDSTTDQSNSYFVIDYPTNMQTRVLYDRSWPHRIEIFGTDDNLMVAEPVGNQQGLGIIGFCYVPYHFVYDLSFPVMIQILEGEEVFQFPIVVIVDNNLPRQGAISEISSEQSEVDACEFRTESVEIVVQDVNLNSVDAQIDYSCAGQVCDLGQTVNGAYLGTAPSCFNGEVLISAEGYGDYKEVFSTNSENYHEAVLSRLHEVELVLKVDGLESDENAIVSFSGERVVSTALPSNNVVRLVEGEYEVSVQVYGNSSAVIPGSTSTECVEVAKSGILGFFGGTDERCFPIEIPETKVEFALKGGGTSETYLLESQLESGVLELDVRSLPRPDSLDQLQANYAIFETRGVGII